MKVLLNSIDKVKTFVSTVSLVDYDIDIVHGRYVVDSKSIMGLLSLDLSKPGELFIHSEHPDDAAALFKTLDSMGLIYHD